jgi:hypothetical protein
MILYYVDFGPVHWYGTLAEAKRAARFAAEDGDEVSVERVTIGATKKAIVNLANAQDCTGPVVYTAKRKRG